MREVMGSVKMRCMQRCPNFVKNNVLILYADGSVSKSMDSQSITRVLFLSFFSFV